MDGVMEMSMRCVRRVCVCVSVSFSKLLSNFNVKRGKKGGCVKTTKRNAKVLG